MLPPIPCGKILQWKPERILCREGHLCGDCKRRSPRTLEEIVRINTEALWGTHIHDGDCPGDEVCTWAMLETQIRAAILEAVERLVGENRQAQVGFNLRGSDLGHAIEGWNAALDAILARAKEGLKDGR
jgi:hypothetical protein